MARTYGIETPDYPKKLFYKINEVASITGVEAYVLRYWETKFPTLAPEKDDNDQRRYRQKDIELIFFIKHLLYDEKYTIAGAVEVLKQGKGGKGKRGGKRGRKAASVEEVEVDIEEGTDASMDEEAVEEPGEDAGTLKEVQTQVATIRKNVRSMLSEIKAWRAKRD